MSEVGQLQAETYNFLKFVVNIKANKQIMMMMMASRGAWLVDLRKHVEF